MDVAMITNQTNSMPMNTSQTTTRMMMTSPYQYSPSSSSSSSSSCTRSPRDLLLTYDDGLDRHPSRLKRARLNHEQEQRKPEEEETTTTATTTHDGPTTIRASPWPTAHPELGKPNHHQDKTITATTAGRSNKPDEDQNPEGEAEGDISPSSSFYSSCSSTLTQSYSSQRSSPFQPPSPEQAQPCQFSWLAERIGWTKQPVMDEMELLAVIEKQAETYSSGPGSEDLLTSPSVLPGTCQTQPGEAWPTHHHHQQQQPHPEMLAAPYASAPHQPSRPIQPLPSRQQPALPSTQPTAVQDKPYKCTLCPKSFTRNYDLTRHKSSHIDQRQHRCSKCGRSFNRRDALIRHTLVKSCGLNS
ncbi:hypothetical protein PCANC_00108 [Puccinia coronata f. sp. avenae]|uniref:C2H2-type domain-containing protein n=2 Tax=Puccinia coronata f. sp. avenae TaxID=200324 RepID=A0A2N5W8L6_9BASI|nr:hypothetical protein PCANC_00108 [Puccinia coronata f. sp. avenae]